MITPRPFRRVINADRLCAGIKLSTTESRSTGLKQLSELQQLYQTTKRESLRQAILETENEILALEISPTTEASDDAIALARELDHEYFESLSTELKADLYRLLVDHALINGDNLVSVTLKF